MLRRQHWTFHYFPNRNVERIEMVAAVKKWATAVDVFALFELNEAVSYRTPITTEGDPFNPSIVTWLFQGDPVWAVRGIASMPAPGAIGERPWAQEAPSVCSRVAALASKAQVIRPPQQEDKG